MTLRYHIPIYIVHVPGVLTIFNFYSSFLDAVLLKIN